MDWSWEFVAEILPRLLNGLVTTVIATVIGSAIGLAFGLLLAVAQFLRIPVANQASRFYLFIVRGTPFLIQLYVLFYVLPDFGIVMSPLATGSIGLGLMFSTYFSETFRAGLESVARGQWEAATALNIPVLRTWRTIVIPQAIKPILPALGNYVNQMFKVSALLATIAVQELFGTATAIGNSVFRYIEPMTIVGICYLVVSIPISILVHRLQDRRGTKVFV
jgi:polar amino acid transport system permease protein